MTMEDISWKLIDKYFVDNPNNLVAHHLDSYNNFMNGGIHKIFTENSPIRFIERIDDDIKYPNECLLYLGGKDGKNIYFGKPIIYDDNNTHYMYPNDARLRNMTYGVTIHYDVIVDFVFYIDGVKKLKTITLEKIYLGRFPIMVQSNLCILNGLHRNLRYNMGECKNDPGGYFIIDGKEKTIIAQEKFADNMIYIKTLNKNDIYSHLSEIRSVSEDSSKQIRKTTVKIIRPTKTYSNNQIVVFVPNVKKPVPLFILMRALGIISDKDIIKTCLLDLDKNKSKLELFIPSVQDGVTVLDQPSALNYIKTFTKRNTLSDVMQILSDYFLPHVGELNFSEKAYFIGVMVNKMLNVFTEKDKPTNRDSFKFKRVELSGTLIHDLFREYFLIQKRAISVKLDNEYYFHRGKYIHLENDDDQMEYDEKNKENYVHKFFSLIEQNYNSFFKERDIEAGFKKAFKGNWGAQAFTKRVGVIQDLNRLSWNSFMSQLRKINLPLDSTNTLIGPRHLHPSQWGVIDPVDCPDGGNIGLHKHLTITAVVTSGSSSGKLIEWLQKHTNIQNILDYNSEYLEYNTKIFVNGKWAGIIETPIEFLNELKLYRRNGIIPIYTSMTFNYASNEIHIYTDSGRLTRPIYYIEDNKPSFDRNQLSQLFDSNKITWSQVISGLKIKSDDQFNVKLNKLYAINDLYSDLTEIHQRENENESDNSNLKILHENKSIVDYLDTSEEENSLISPNQELLSKNKYYTHVEIDPSLMFGVMGNQIIYPENNPLPRNVFSCGQSRQAVSLYHSNYQMRMDKMGVVLNGGQIPLIKSRYMEYINNEEHPYGVNAIVAIMCYTGYNVEDAILINEGAVARGIFRTTYYSTYEGREESSTISGTTNSRFTNIEKSDTTKLKKDYDYSMLDDYGLVVENTPITEKTILIGKKTSDSENSDTWIDSSIKTKKGQLGFVDKSFVTQGEDGFNIAKVRIREERIPAIGDKMASRAGQKGTLGLIIPEKDMPFMADGTKPDLVINPHAIPSRMTLGQIIESLLGIVCTEYGMFGDCTPFQTKGPNTELYGKMLTNSGYHSSGKHILYNGMTGEQVESSIYMGPTYYERLKHMVKDKINHRARGKMSLLTRQTNQGRADDGGLRIGEMERDCIISNGMSYFLNESFMKRGDEYFMAVCNKTGTIAIYNKPKNLFLSPMADGPINFNYTSDGNMNVKNISRFGRSFSILRIPYSFKLLIHELQTMNIQMRIITDKNIDHLSSMGFSYNINKLMNMDENSKEFLNIKDEYRKQCQNALHKTNETDDVVVENNIIYNESPDVLPTDNTPTSLSPEWHPEPDVKWGESVQNDSVITDASPSWHPEPASNWVESAQNDSVASSASWHPEPDPNWGESVQNNSVISDASPSWHPEPDPNWGESVQNNSVISDASPSWHPEPDPNWNPDSIIKTAQNNSINILEPINLDIQPIDSINGGGNKSILIVDDINIADNNVNNVDVIDNTNINTKTILMDNNNL